MLVSRPSQSLFGELTNHGYNPARDPAEERLTEAFAATLRSGENAVRHLLRALGVTDLPAADVEVTTQRYTSAGDRVDIEVRFGPVQRPALLVWLELKWDADPDDEQLRRYRAALDALGWEQTHLVFVGRSGVMPSKTSPGIHESWQHIALALLRWLQSTDNPDLHESVMAREFIAYLEENNLAATEAFGIADALALSSITQAHARIKQVIERAASDVAAEFVTGTVKGYERAEWAHVRDPMDFWKNYGPPAPNPSGWPQSHWLEWHAREDHLRERPRSEAVFGAGVASEAADAFEDESYGDWLRHMGTLGFEYSGVRPRRDHVYLFRYLQPAELVAAGDLEEQGHLLGRWVRESFALLLANPPRGGAL